ncbi:MAG TPA: ribokinase [Planctomycetota bacterium]|nr:ribokinase [Planctomycetota bacterium]
MVKIAVIGSLNMDLVVQAPSLPGVGETLLGGPFGSFPGGKGGNQAVAAARLGAEVTMIGAVGRDDFAGVLGAALVEAKVTPRLQTVAAATGIALVTTAPGGDNTIVVVPGANASLDPAFVEAETESIAAADMVVLQLEASLAAVATGVRIAKKKDRRVLLNAAPAQALDDALLRQVAVLIVNRYEAKALVTVKGGKLEALLQALRGRGPQIVAITLGAEGAVACDGDEVCKQAGFKVDAIDAVAAGDAFTGALAVALAEGTALPGALRFACAAGALTTLKRGAQASLPTRAEVEAFLAKQK